MFKAQWSVKLIPFPASCLCESCGQQARPRLALALSPTFILPFNMKIIFLFYEQGKVSFGQVSFNHLTTYLPKWESAP